MILPEGAGVKFGPKESIAGAKKVNLEKVILEEVEVRAGNFHESPGRMSLPRRPPVSL
jgi:hypothetical protein